MTIIGPRPGPNRIPGRKHSGSRNCYCLLVNTGTQTWIKHSAAPKQHVGSNNRPGQTIPVSVAGQKLHLPIYDYEQALGCGRILVLDGTGTKVGPHAWQDAGFELAGYRIEISFMANGQVWQNLNFAITDYRPHINESVLLCPTPLRTYETVAVKLTHHGQTCRLTLARADLSKVPLELTNRELAALKVRSLGRPQLPGKPRAKLRERLERSR